jgi:predicted AAA+ superfamily ATPase
MKKYTIKRHLENTLRNLIKQYKCLILTGPRQVGKSTLLEEGVLPKNKKFNHVKLDNDNVIDFAKKDPLKFLKDNQTPLFIDEIQKAPRLFSYMKTIIDSSEKRGQFVVTGSEAFELMKGVSDHLSTRAVVVTMQSLSNSEINRMPNFEFVPNFDEFLKRKCPEISDEDIFNRIIRGSMPDLIKNKGLNPYNFYETYIKSLIIKDIKED